MTTSLAKRREAVLVEFDKFERMLTLFCCLGRAPSYEEKGDECDEELDVYDDLESEGFLEESGGFYTTTPSGRDELIAYVNGTDDGDLTTEDE